MYFQLRVARISLFSILLVLCCGIAHALGPLTVGRSKPRYFIDSGGTAVYLSGVHLNNNLIDRSDKPIVDFSAYLDFLQAHNLNFVRLWVWEQAAWTHESAQKLEFGPLPYERTGPGNALDGNIKFDLTRFNQAYFDRLRFRVAEAQARGIYVSVMLFQGFSSEPKTAKANPWPGHPFHRDNNINGIDGDPSGNGSGEEVHSLTVPAITKFQEDYVRKVIDTLNGFDNVLYEISGESPLASKDWQYHMIDYIKSYQNSKPYRHPVGISYFYRGTEEELFNSPADWVLLLGNSTDPPLAAGDKVMVQDMDPSLLKTKAPWQWVWKSFTRGYNPIYMDADPVNANLNVQVREALSDAASFSQILDLSSMSPSSNACSSHYCLVNPGFEYLVYLPSGGPVTVDLSAGKGNFKPSWFSPPTGQNFSAATVRGGSKVVLTPPFQGEAVLYLAAESQTVSGSQVVSQDALRALASDSFSLSSGGTLSTAPGASAITNITATLAANTSFLVKFSLSGLPQGVSASFSRSSCRQTCSTLLKIHTAASTPTGTFTLTVKATSAGGEKSTNIVLNVNPRAAASARLARTGSFDFSLSDSGSKSVNAGSAVTNSIRVTLTSGRTQPVSFSVSGVPSGATAAFSSAHCNPTCSRVLTIKTGAATPGGSFPITVAAAGGAVTRTTTFTLVIVQTIVTPTVPPNGGTPVGQGLVAHWTFDEGSGTTASDASGNGNTATLINGPVWSAGKVGSALYFDGIDDNLVVANSSSLNLSGSFTLSAWVNPASAFTDFRSILVKNYTYYLYASVAGYCGSGNPLGGFAVSVDNTVCQASPLPANTWIHIALTYDGSTLTLYRNGVAVANAAAAGALSLTTETLQIGASQYGEYFQGLIDEVRIYNRALTATEIQAFYPQESIQTPTPLAPPTISGSLYYVATNGSDANPGTLSQPFRTIAQGISALQPNDKLYIRNGTYAETINSNNQTIPTGTSWSDAPLISAYPGETVTLRPNSAGEVVNLAHSYIQYVIFNGMTLDAINAGFGVSGWGGAHHVRFQNGVIKSASKSGVLLAHGNGLSSDYFEFINMKIHDNGLSLYDHGVYIATSHNLVDRSEIYNNVGYGIHVYNGAPGEQASDNTLRGNTIHNNALVDVSSAGIILSSGDGNLAYNNIIQNNSYGISVNYRATNSKIYNNVVYANTYYGIDVGGGSTSALVKNNIVYQNGWTISDAGSGTVTSNNLTTDPQFVNPSASDFHLQSTSPAIDAGATLTEVATDLSGVARPQRQAYDIGAYEFQ
ncbi:MAG TPA: LamG-like jellyroll fold domain-containing protein [Candidatus Binatia bacterium]|nr:LamG-like jellyroll fold domain-containing protein [Candidatus Binatia bacterium]